MIKTIRESLRLRSIRARLLLSTVAMVFLLAAVIIQAIVDALQ